MIIGIDMGHTLKGANTGASGCGHKEQDLTREVGRELIKILNSEGVRTVNCTVDSASSDKDSLRRRVQKANVQKLDFFVSIHFNACVNDEKGNGRTTGTEVWLYNTKHMLTATRVVNRMAALGLKNRGVKRASHYVTKHTIAPAILVECCFIDDRDDMNLYNAHKFAKAIAEGLLNRTIQDKPALNDGSETYYRAVAGSYTVRANANEQIDKLKKIGYTPFLDAFHKNGKTFLRVVVESNNDRKKTEATIAELKRKGFDADLMVYIKK